VENVISWLFSHWLEITEAVGLLFTAASIVTGLTPTPKDDEWLKKAAAFVSFVTSKDLPGTFKAPLTPPPSEE